MTHLSIARRVAGALVGLTALSIIAAQASAASFAAVGAGSALSGTFKLAPGSCTGAAVSGSYFRMIYPGGNPTTGKFFDNPDSSCSTKSYTLVAPGSDGGLETGVYQPSPTPAFDAKGDATVKTIITPAGFSEIKFGLATLAKDPTSGKAVPAPAISANGGKLVGQVEALYAEWNKLYFNQGSAAVSGTYDSTTHVFVLTWSSPISGGPFNGFTGSWHLTGTFAPR